MTTNLKLIPTTSGQIITILIIGSIIAKLLGLI
jgi:hypothetical protein